MCKALLPGDDESVSDDAIWETLPVSSADKQNIFGWYNYVSIFDKKRPFDLRD